MGVEGQAGAIDLRSDERTDKATTPVEVSNPKKKKKTKKFLKKRCTMKKRRRSRACANRRRRATDLVAGVDLVL
ncbi:hypothetical protein BHM03_00010283 [Ensete ventricosum]|uniref:Uncharacterized protein n=1 Tax=Ensete ventricosum TaxID=4639 RepID=A0A445MCY0_ENSVE|nr:hypothetical protein BHM03_00010283 [Ensete ventricosum]